jgi:ADP-ribose pyrophosphatase
VEIYSIDELKQLLKENKIIQAMHVSCILYAFEKMGIIKMWS